MNPFWYFYFGNWFLLSFQIIIYMRHSCFCQSDSWFCSASGKNHELWCGSDTNHELLCGSGKNHELLCGSGKNHELLCGWGKNHKLLCGSGKNNILAGANIKFFMLAEAKIKYFKLAWAKIKEIFESSFRLFCPCEARQISNHLRWSLLSFIQIEVAVHE